MLVILILGSACFGVLWKNWWLPWQSQKNAVQLINARCGMGGVEFGDVRYESMDEFPQWKRALAKWFGKDSVARVDLAFCDGTGEIIDIECWKGLPSVERVGFDRTLIEDLGPIAGFKKLKSFRVFQCGCTPAKGKHGLEVLGGCPILESVKLTFCNFPIDDKILESICSAKNLREFEFDPSKCTNLKPLLNLSKLESLTIWLESPPCLVDLDAIAELSNLNELSIWVSSRNNVEYDFAFLGGLGKLKKCQIHANLNTQKRESIRELLPESCQLTFD